MKTFKENTELSSRSICDHSCIYTGEVLKRTAKTVTIKTDMKGVSRCKIHSNEDGEYIFPFGRYSMAPVFRAV